MPGSVYFQSVRGNEATWPAQDAKSSKCNRAAFIRYSSVLCLAGSGKGVAGLPFGFLKGQFGAITGDAALLARLTRWFPVWLAQNAP